MIKPVFCNVSLKRRMLYAKIINMFNNHFNIHLDRDVYISNIIPVKKEMVFSSEYESTVVQTGTTFKLNNRIHVGIGQTCMLIEIKSLIHELFHVKQIINNDLDFTKDYIIWKQNYYLMRDVALMTYVKMPWEIEPLANEKEIMTMFINKLSVIELELYIKGYQSFKNKKSLFTEVIDMEIYDKMMWSIMSKIRNSLFHKIMNIYKSA